MPSRQPTRISLSLKGESPESDNNAGGADFRPEHLAGISFKRVMAYLIDLVILAIIQPIIWFAFIIAGVLSFGLLSPLLMFAFGFTALIYHTLLIGSPWSATLGMRLMGIEVRAWNGNRPGLLQAALQTIIFFVTVYSTSGLILVVALFNERRRCLHDYLAGTVVVNAMPWPSVKAAPTEA